jgi:cobalt/nickel transport system permease protein
MHIPDGILPITVTAPAFIGAAAVTWYALKRVRKETNIHSVIPRASILTAAFIVGSWISIPIPPVSVHFLLAGMMGLLLGYFSFLSILTGLFFQAVLFQHGGLTTIGVNALCFGLAAILVHHLFKGWMQKRKEFPKTLIIIGFLSGFVGTGISVILFYFVLISFIPADMNVISERKVITLLSIAHLPVMILEGIFTVALLLYFRRVKPDLLEGISK